MSLNINIIETDNRDSTTTTLRLQSLSVDIDPQDMMLNMIQNLPVPLDERYEPIFRVLCDCIEKDLEAIADNKKPDSQDEYMSLIQIVNDTLKK